MRSSEEVVQMQEVVRQHSSEDKASSKHLRRKHNKEEKLKAPAQKRKELKVSQCKGARLVAVAKGAKRNGHCQAQASPVPELDPLAVTIIPPWECKGPPGPLCTPLWVRVRNTGTFRPPGARLTATPPLIRSSRSPNLLTAASG